MRQSLSLSRPAVAKMLHVSLRTLHNWETGKVRIPYAAYKLIRLFNSYEIFHPIWKDWRIVGSRLITPEGHALEAGNFHWLSLMARRADAFGKTNQLLMAKRKADCQSVMATAPSEIDVNNHDFGSCSTGLVFNSTSGTFLNKNQQIRTSLPTLLWVNNQNPIESSPPSSNTGGKSSIYPPLPIKSHRSFHQQLPTGGAL